MTLRLEPLLKECMTSAAAVPILADELKQFVDQVQIQSGFNIEYGDTCLMKDNREYCFIFF